MVPHARVVCDAGVPLLARTHHVIRGGGHLFKRFDRRSRCGVHHADIDTAGADQECRAAIGQLQVGTGRAGSETDRGGKLAAILLEAKRQARHDRLTLWNGGLWGRGGKKRTGAHEQGNSILTMHTNYY